MKERPILFSAPMVRALLYGTKTQTRRLCKPAQTHALSRVVEVPDPQERGQVYNRSHFGDEDGDIQFACPYGGKGDRLWVREAFDFLPSGGPDQPQACDIVYWASGSTEPRTAPSDYNPMIYGHQKVRPSIHMPRWASRILLEITDVRVERLQAISRADAQAEGCDHNDPCDHVRHSCASIGCQGPDYRVGYRQLWDQINGAGAWEANPWVWAITFRRVEGQRP